MFKYLKKLILALLSVYIFGAVWISFEGINDSIFNADVIIVLGNKVEMNGQPSSRLKARLDRAIELFKDGKAQLIFVSGGVGKEKFDESVVMANYLIQKNIPETSIIMDGQGVDTISTAANASVYMKKQGFNSAIVVSQYFHIKRAKLSLKAQGISSIGNAYAKFFEIRDIYSIFREFPAYISYYWKYA